MLKLQILSVVTNAAFLAVVIHNVRRKRIREGYALLWVGITVVMMILSVWIEPVAYFSAKVGIQTPSNALLLGFVFGILLLLFQYLVLLSQNQQKISTLVQEVALLKRRLEELEKERSAEPPSGDRS